MQCFWVYLSTKYMNLGLPFIYTPTSSRTQRQVVNWGHFCLRHGLEKNKGFSCVLSAPRQSSTFLLNAANVSQRQCQGLHSSRTKLPGRYAKSSRGRFRGECDEQEVPWGSRDDQNDLISTLIIICIINSLLTYSSTQERSQVPPSSLHYSLTRNLYLKWHIKRGNASSAGSPARKDWQAAWKCFWFFRVCEERCPIIIWPTVTVRKQCKINF